MWSSFWWGFAAGAGVTFLFGLIVVWPLFWLLDKFAAGMAIYGRR